MFFNAPLHMDVLVLANQQELIYISSGKMELATQFQILDAVVCASLQTNTLEKSTNLSLLSQ